MRQLRTLVRASKIGAELDLRLLPPLQHHFSAHLLWEFPRFAYGILRDIARILRMSCGTVGIRLRFRKYEVDRRVGRMVHLALRAFVLAGRGALEFVRDALDF